MQNENIFKYLESVLKEIFEELNLSKETDFFIMKKQYRNVLYISIFNKGIDSIIFLIEVCETDFGKHIDIYTLVSGKKKKIKPKHNIELTKKELTNNYELLLDYKKEFINIIKEQLCRTFNRYVSKFIVCVGEEKIFINKVFSIDNVK